MTSRVKSVQTARLIVGYAEAATPRTRQQEEGATALTKEAEVEQLEVAGQQAEGDQVEGAEAHLQEEQALSRNAVKYGNAGIGFQRNAR